MVCLVAYHNTFILSLKHLTTKAKSTCLYLFYWYSVFTVHTYWNWNGGVLCWCCVCYVSCPFPIYTHTLFAWTLKENLWVPFDSKYLYIKWVKYCTSRLMDLRWSVGFLKDITTHEVETPYNQSYSRRYAKNLKYNKFFR